MLKKLSLLDALFYLATVVSITISFTLLYKISAIAPVSSDSGHYLYFANLIYEHDLVPFKDFLCEYSPGYFYFMAAIWGLFGNDYSTTMLAVMVVSVVAVTLSSYLAMKLLKNKKVFWLNFSIMLPIWIVYAGADPYLEPFVITALVPAVHIYLLCRRNYKNIFLCGLLFGTAVMFKQWAVCFIVLFLFHLIWTCSLSKKNYRLMLTFIIGVGFPFTLFCTLCGLPLFDTAWKLATFGGEQYVQPFSGLGYVLSHYAEMYVFYFPLVAAIVYAAIRWKKGTRLLIASCVIGLAISSFQPEHHYFLFTLPWAMILLCRLLISSYSTFIRLPLAFRLSCIIIALIVLAIPMNRVSFYYERYQKTGRVFNTFYGGLDPNIRTFQQAKADILHAWCDKEGREVTIHGEMAMQCLFPVNILDHRAIFGSLSFPYNKDIFDDKIIGHCDIITVRKQVSRTGTDALEIYLLDKGYQLAYEDVLKGQKLKYFKKAQP